MVAGGVAVLFVLNTWGIGFVEDDGSAGFLGISVVTLFLAYSAWTAIRSYFDRKIAGPRSSSETCRATRRAMRSRRSRSWFSTTRCS